ncbi:MAG: ABC transporter ATP-binding protein [Rhodospirillales bacterium]
MFGFVMLIVNALHRPGLAPVTLDFAAGERAVLAGPSGSGKTLFLRALADLDPNTGQVVLEDSAREAMPAPDWRRLAGYLGPRPAWWLERVGDHFEANREDEARSLFAAVGLEGQAWHWPVERLSTGEAQRLALVRLLLNRPRLLLLDEPTSGLDGEATVRVEHLLAERAAAGCIILMVSHDRAQATRFARRHLSMDKGHLTDLGEGGAP